LTKTYYHVKSAVSFRSAIGDQSVTQKD